MAAKVITDDQAVAGWLEHLEASRGRSARTLEVYSLALERLRKFLEHDGRALVDANAQELETFCGIWLHKLGVVARSRKPYISAVKGFYGWLRKQGHIRANPAESLLHPQVGRKLPRAMSLANAERLMWAPDLGTFIGIRDAAMLSLMIGCGIRVGGLIMLNESNLRTIKIDNTPRMVLRVLEKGDKERMVPVPREAEMLLRVYLGHEELAEIDRDILDRRGQADKVLFVSVRSTLLDPSEHRGENRRLTRKAVHDLVQRYGKRLGIPRDELHPHAMRHLFGTELIEENVTTLAVQDLMGHSDPKSTEIYVHLAVRRKAGLIDQHGPLGRINTPVRDLLKRLPPGS